MLLTISKVTKNDKKFMRKTDLIETHPWAKSESWVYVIPVYLNFFKLGQ